MFAHSFHKNHKFADSSHTNCQISIPSLHLFTQHILAVFVHTVHTDSIWLISLPCALTTHTHCIGSHRICPLSSTLWYFCIISHLVYAYSAYIHSIDPLSANERYLLTQFNPNIFLHAAHIHTICSISSRSQYLLVQALNHSSCSLRIP